MAAYGITAARPPAILIADMPPSLASQQRENRKNPRVIVLPLRSAAVGSGSVTGVLTSLVTALQTPDAIAALEKLDRKGLQRWWSWLRFLELKPNFFGFGLNLNAAIEEALLPR
jgi:hypothetical protein